MWQLLKIEINYHSILLTIAIILFVQIVFYSLTPYYEQINFILLTLFSIVFLSTVIERNKISIDRQNFALPFSKTMLGLERAILIFVPWLILIPSFYLLNFFIFPSNIDSITRLIGEFGFSLILVSSFILGSDFYFSEGIHDSIVKYFMIAISVIFIVTIDAAYILITNSLFNGLLIPGGIVLIYAWGIFLTLLTVVTFCLRKTFL